MRPFRDAAELHRVFDRLFDLLSTDPGVGPRLRAKDTPQRFVFPDLATTLVQGLRVSRSCEEAVRGADVVMVLRVQRERLAGLKVSLPDYISRYQITMGRLRMAKADALLMHPGPIIRGLEVTWDVADCPQSVIVEEVKNGVPLRMAVLARALGRAR